MVRRSSTKTAIGEVRGSPARIHDLAWAYAELRATGRGKHVRSFSYYHVSLIAQRPHVASFLSDLRSGFGGSFDDFNVVKLDERSRVSFLRYEDFDPPFPVLLFALSCDSERGTWRQTDYAHRRNPPILHRKELLLPGDDPRVPQAERLTRCLEGRGAFADAKSIGTRDGWHRRLGDLGLDGLVPAL